MSKPILWNCLAKSQILNKFGSEQGALQMQRFAVYAKKRFIQGHFLCSKTSHFVAHKLRNYMKERNSKMKLLKKDHNRIYRGTQKKLISRTKKVE